MTRKQYQALAAILRDVPIDYHAQGELVDEISEVFAAADSKFKAESFRSAVLFDTDY